MPSPVSASAELIAALSRGLAVVRASWYVSGAQAVLIWGRPRFTADVDVTVRLEPEEPDRLIELLEDALSVNDLIPVFDREWRRVSS